MSTEKKHNKMEQKGSVRIEITTLVTVIVPVS